MVAVLVLSWPGWVVDYRAPGGVYCCAPEMDKARMLCTEIVLFGRGGARRKKGGCIGLRTPPPRSAGTTPVPSAAGLDGDSHKSEP